MGKQTHIIGLCLAALFCASSSLAAVAVRNCNTIKVPVCKELIARDVVFLVDASESLDRARFYNEMLNYLQSLWCALNVEFNNRGTIITFGYEVKQRIPFKYYTPVEWFDTVENLRDDASLCCKCCTPTAEAFSSARKLLINNRRPDRHSTVVYVITDGNPYGADDQTFGIQWLFPKFNPGVYRYRIVPREANLLKDSIEGLRIMLVGVPNKENEPPAIGYFAGIPNPEKYPAGVTSGNVQCEVRGSRTFCDSINKPPFPIVSLPLDKHLFNAQGWDVKDLLNQTSTDLCRLRETFSPTPAPTRPSIFEGLDVYVFVDRSRSITYSSRADVCRQAPGANKQAGDSSVCWQLFMRFAETLVANATRLHAPNNELFGWQATRPDISKGVRVWVYGFACAEEQSVPVVERIGEAINNQADFVAAMTAAKLLIPKGGTCPSAALERAVGQIMAENPLDRPFKTAVLLTDGVFYDQPRPALVAQGLDHFGVMNYALGIAIPEAGDNHGLKPFEIVDQKKQLLEFANSPDRVLNFGQEGLLLLDDIASGIITSLRDSAVANYPMVYDRPFTCTYTSNERCLSMKMDLGEPGRFCKWIPDTWSKFSGRGKCLDKDVCGLWRSRETCAKDKFCDWSSRTCKYNGVPLSDYV